MVRDPVRPGTGATGQTLIKFDGQIKSDLEPYSQEPFVTGQGTPSVLTPSLLSVGSLVEIRRYTVRAPGRDMDVEEGEIGSVFGGLHNGYNREGGARGTTVIVNRGGRVAR